jgi:hypothetical protein
VCEEATGKRYNSWSHFKSLGIPHIKKRKVLLTNSSKHPHTRPPPSRDSLIVAKRAV